MPYRMMRARCPTSSGLLARAADNEPGASPMLLETLARTGGTPRANRVGNVIKVPVPTIALIRPAAPPASAMSSSSHQLTSAGSRQAR